MHLMKDQRKGVWSSGPGEEGGPRIQAAAQDGQDRRRHAHRRRRRRCTRCSRRWATSPSFTGGDDWAYEMKWDGYRAIATVRGWRGRACARATGSTSRRPIPSCGDSRMRSATARCSTARSWRSTRRAARVSSCCRGTRRTVQYFVFDVLQTRRRSRSSRCPTTSGASCSRRRCARAMPSRSPATPGADLKKALATSSKLGLEGVMAKRRDSPYREGKRSRDWIKLKHTRTQEVVIGGWRPGKGARADTVGSLLFGIPDGGELRYAGRVGTGFTRRRADEAARAARRAGPQDQPARRASRARTPATRTGSRRPWSARSSTPSAPPRAACAPPPGRAGAPTRTPHEVVPETPADCQ